MMLNDKTVWLTPNAIAAQMVSVQPMDSNLIHDMKASIKSERELIEQGYHPVDSTTKLMWIKDPI